MAGLFQNCNHLLPLNARKTLQEVINGIATLEMIKKALDGDARPHKDGCAAQNAWIAMDNRFLLHNGTVADQQITSKLARSLGETPIKFSVRSNPKPKPFVVLVASGECTIISCDTDRPHAVINF